MLELVLQAVAEKYFHFSFASKKNLRVRYWYIWLVGSHCSSPKVRCKDHAVSKKNSTEVNKHVFLYTEQLSQFFDP